MNLLKVKGFKKIYALEVFEKEFRKLFKKNNDEYRQYLKRLRSKLKLLDKYGRVIVDQINTIESLKETELFAIRLIGKQNVRVIFAIVVSQKIILLQSFEEGNKNNYNLALQTAKERLKLIGEKHEEKDISNKQQGNKSI